MRDLHPGQLSLFDATNGPKPSAPSRPSRRPRGAKADQLALPLREPPALRVIQGEGAGTGHRRGRLVGLPHPELDAPLPSRAEITRILLQAGADLVAGRISPAGAAAIREAAEEALDCLEASERHPDLQPSFVRAVRALSELCG
jgi:hypothetical protein